MDIEAPGALISYLRTAGRIGAAETPEVRVLGGGVSNRTVWLRRPNGDTWVLKQALEKLRVAVDWFSSPERVHREALGMQQLGTLAPAGTITPLLFEDQAHHLLAMQAVPEPHESWKTMLLDGRVAPRHVEQFGAILGSVHRRSAEAPERLAPDLLDQSFFESLRLEPYYLYTAERVPAAAAFLEDLVVETRATRLTLVHGDYSPKNILVHDDRLVLLDHEVIHFGDGTFDLGFALAHLLSKAHHLPASRSLFARAALDFWASYASAARPEGWPGFEARASRHALGCLLARVDGRSRLEYLNDVERTRQRAAVLALVPSAPETIAELVARFLERL